MNAVAIEAASANAAADAIVQRADARYAAHRQDIFRDTDRLFSWLLLGQWVFGVLLAIVVSPHTWAGRTSSIHEHVWIALVGGGLITVLPVYLARKHPGATITRHTIAVSQMLWSAILIHVTGGRIETHFHIFGSLAFLAFYRDWPVIITGTLTVVADHLLRGLLWPESVYGLVNPEWWRFMEHGFWVVFCVSFLIVASRKSQKDMQVMAERSAELEALSENAWRNSSVVDRVAADAAGA
jgi:hypothetical protein